MHLGAAGGVGRAAVLIRRRVHEVDVSGLCHVHSIQAQPLWRKRLTAAILECIKSGKSPRILVRVMPTVTHPTISALCIVCDEPMRNPRRLYHTGAENRSCYNQADKVIANLLGDRVCVWCGGPIDKMTPPVSICCDRKCYRNRRVALTRGYIIGECPRCGAKDAYYTSARELSCPTCGYYTIGGAEPGTTIGMLTPAAPGRFRDLHQRVTDGGNTVLSHQNLIKDSGGALAEQAARVAAAERERAQMWAELNKAIAQQ